MVETNKLIFKLCLDSRYESESNATETVFNIKAMLEVESPNKQTLQFCCNRFRNGNYDVKNEAQRQESK